MPTALAPTAASLPPEVAAGALDTLCAVAADLASATDLDAVVPGLLARLAPVLGATGCSVWLPEAAGRPAPRWVAGEPTAPDDRSAMLGRMSM